MNWSIRYAIAQKARWGTRLNQQVFKNIRSKTQSFYDNGGSIQIHHIGDVNKPDMQKHYYIQDQIDKLSKVQPVDSPHQKALSNTIYILKELSNVYKNGKYESSWPGEHSSKIYLAMHSGNVVGSFRTNEHPEMGEHAAVNLATSLMPTAATALNHAAITQYLAPKNLGASSVVYSRKTTDEKWGRGEQRAKQKAQKYHQELGRRVGWGTGTDNYPSSPGNWSVWTPGDVQELNKNISVPNAKITHH